MKKLMVTIGAAFLVACTLLFVQSNYTHLAEYDRTIYASVLTCVTNAPARSSNYADGVNDALDAVKRVTAKLPDGTNLAMEAVCELVCEELHVERRK